MAFNPRLGILDRNPGPGNPVTSVPVTPSSSKEKGFTPVVTPGSGPGWSTLLASTTPGTSFFLLSLEEEVLLGATSAPAGGATSAPLGGNICAPPQRFNRLSHHRNANIGVPGLLQDVHVTISANGLDCPLYGTSAQPEP